MAKKPEPGLHFTERTELGAWLKTQPREISVAIAARAASRVLPLVGSGVVASGEERRDDPSTSLTAAAFRAIGVARFFAKHSGLAGALRGGDADNAAIAVSSVAHATGHTEAAAAGDAIAAACYAVSVSNYDYAASGAAQKSADASGEASDPGAYTGDAWHPFDGFDPQVNEIQRALGGAWQAITMDAHFIESGEPVALLMDRTLWPKSSPHQGSIQPWATERWAALKAALPRNEGWDVWIDWYDDILAGRAHSDEYDLVFATVPQELWQTPAAANAWIKEQLAKLVAQPGAYDFFLSYSKKDEAFAKFVDAVLRGAGYSVFAMFRDIPPGSEFVREMNRGLAASKRVVALLSPHYVASDHCQAEWGAAYAADASGAKRKLIPLLIENADLTPLASTRRFESLIALSRADAAKAILHALGHRGQAAPPDARWPGAQALDAMASAAGKLVNIRPDMEKRLAPGPVAPADDVGKTDGFGAEALYALLRRKIMDFAKHVLRQDGGNFQFSRRLREAAEALLRDAPEKFSEVNPLLLDLALSQAQRALFLDAQDELLPPRDMIMFSPSDLHGERERLMRMDPRLEQFRKQSARDKILPLDPEARAALEKFITKISADRSVVSQALARDFDETKQALERAESFSPTGSETEKLENVVDAHLVVAAMILVVWNWIANPREKFKGAGIGANEQEFRNYDKLYAEVSPHTQRYLEWLLKWYC